MCIGAPVKIVESGEFVSRAEGRNGVVEVNMMLIGEQPVGTWVLNFLGTAREVLTEQQAEEMNLALDGLSEIMSGNDNVDIDQYFPGLGEQANKNS